LEFHTPKDVSVFIFSPNLYRWLMTILKALIDIKCHNFEFIFAKTYRLSEFAFKPLGSNRMEKNGGLIII
jgi:hypothetical protein